MSSDDPKSYRDAGVDIHAGYEAVRRYQSSVEATRVPGVLGAVGGFGGLFSLRDAGVDLADPVLVSATDGVGTKLKLAFELGIHDTIGIDCVAMCVNDVIATGARPLFFLDYLATGKLDPEQAAAVVEGIARGCAEAGCALVGGETAEMPGFYLPGEYDVAGFCVGVVDRSEILDRDRTQPGDVLVGIESTGFHSNGFSLIRKIVADHLSLDERLGDTTLGEALLAPTRIYHDALLAVRGAVGAALVSVAHVTGGGFHENVPRAVGDACGATIDATTWECPDVIRHVADAGKIPEDERYGIFNMGIGLVLVVRAPHADAAIAALNEAGFPAHAIGSVTDSPGVRITGLS